MADSASLVEICTEELVSGRSLGLLDGEGPDEKMHLNGHRGVVLGVSEEVNEAEEMYVVRTFENVLATVPSDGLRPLYHGNEFDFVWPASEEGLTYEFAWSIAREVEQKGYCAIQMFSSSTDRDGMVAEALRYPPFRMKQEIEAGYMGLNNSSKMARMPAPSGSTEDDSKLRLCDSCFDMLGEILTPLDTLGFKIFGRSEAYIRSSYESVGEELQIVPKSIEEADDWAVDVARYLKFATTRKMCMLHLIENEGGDLWLYPRKEGSAQVIKIDVAANKLVLFRHDVHDFSYQPIGKNLALQAWLSVEDTHRKPITDVQVDLNERWAFANPGLPEPGCRAGHVMALHANMPGNAVGEHCWWTVFAAGMDGVTFWPKTRSFDEDLYYDSDKSSASFQGKSYAKHGGFCSEESFGYFDNTYFGIPAKDVDVMAPTAKWCLEAGMTVLTKAGLSKEDLRGRPVGTWIGDCGPDWHTLYSMFHKIRPGRLQEECHQNIHTAFTTSRLAHMYGMIGPSQSFDTACSSSLVALNQAHSFMISTKEVNYAEALVLGVNVMISHLGYLNCTATEMLSFVGRSFTFNRSADGYCRGEGCGGIFMKRDATVEEVRSRVGSVIGSCCNHDGRSSTLTAPNGPAQSALIKRSMDYAGFDKGLVTMCELHGTGTPLGDPIEVGALHTVMKGRKHPLIEVSTKSHIGHLEPSAGIAGIMKCLMMIRYSCGPANCHVNVINEHIADENPNNPFPRITDTEITDTGVSSGYCGVSSFGFAGTNARCDVYNAAAYGARKALIADLPALSCPKYNFETVDDIFIVGSWNGWSTVDQMEQDDNGAHVCFIKLGETRVEYFRLKLGDFLDEEKDYKTLYPGYKNADSSAEIFGPSGEAGEDRYWMIDGYADEKPSGTTYKVAFEYKKGRTKVWWTPVEDDDAYLETFGEDYTHRYFIKGSLTASNTGEDCKPMLPVEGEDGCFEATFLIGGRDRDEFWLVRDEDLRQVFHLDPEGQIYGPSALKDLKRSAQFVIKTPFEFRKRNAYERCPGKIKLRILNGNATVTLEAAGVVTELRSSSALALT